MGLEGNKRQGLSGSSRSALNSPATKVLATLSAGPRTGRSEAHNWFGIDRCGNHNLLNPKCPRIKLATRGGLQGHSQHRRANVLIRA